MKQPFKSPVKVAITLFLSFSLCPLHAQVEDVAPGFGGVRGKVLGAENVPLVGAQVYAIVRDGAPYNGKLPSTITNERGEFFLNRVTPGINMIMAAKNEDGYPTTLYAVFADEADVPHVTVGGGEIAENVIVTLVKGAILTGEIVDESTREPLHTSDVRIRLSRADAPNLFLERAPDTGRHFRFNLPHRAYLLEISAPGYRTWKESSILMEPESRRDLVVRLQKLPN